MNAVPLQAIFRSSQISTSTEDRLVYSRDASRLEGECLAVVFPTHCEQVAALVDWAGHEEVDLVPRGAGTGLCGGAVPQRSVVVDLSRFTQLGLVDVERRTVSVGAGVALGNLNRQMAVHDLSLPVIPGSHRAATIGGMIATNAAGLHAVRYGRMGEWVTSLTLVDGLGNVEQIKGDALDAVVGREGVTGFVVEATLRLAPRPAERTLSLQAFDDESALLRQRDRWLREREVTALEHLNRHAARAIGWEARPHLLVEFDGPGGETSDATRMAALWKARDGLYPILAQSGHPVIEDPQADGDGLGALLAWLDGEGIPAFGHLGVGIVHPCFRVKDERLATLYERVAGWGGRVSGEHGIGLKKKAWVDAAFRAEIETLKATYDPLNIINRGKLC